MLIALLVVLGALLLVMIVSAMLDQRSRSDQEAEESAEEWARSMESTPFF